MGKQNYSKRRMKLTILIFLFVSIQSIGQNKSYLELRQEYKDYCNEYLVDTIIQKGKVEYEIGDKLQLIPKDTVWQPVLCPDYYEESKGIFNCISSDYVIFADSLTFTGTLIDYNKDYSEPSIETFQTKITRKKYCKVKRRIEGLEDFWFWVEKEYLK